MPPPPGPIEDFLAPLTRLALRHDCEGQVIWAQNGTWQAQDDEADMLDPDEIAFYAEGLLLEGAHLHWHLVAEDGEPVLIRLFFWQDAAPPVPDPEPGLTLAASGRWPPQMTAFDALHAECAALGTILFTVTSHDLTANLARRAYTSHPAEYPTQGTKPLTRDAWFDLCVTRSQPFVANTPEAFREVFFDHALITSMGLGSACNLPLVDGTGRVQATVNLLAGEGHFTPERLAAYQALVAARRAALLSDL